MRSTILPLLAALATTAAAQQGNVLHGGFCCYEGWQHCQEQGAWGCILIDGGGPNCVDQTKQCDWACDRFAYQKQAGTSNDPRCVCSYDDANQPAPYDFQCYP